MPTFYEYQPAGMDLFYEHSVPLAPGTLVRKVQPFGCPRNGTMGMAYVETLDGTFCGLRNLTSLVRYVESDPEEAFGRMLQREDTCVLCDEGDTDHEH